MTPNTHEVEHNNDTGVDSASQGQSKEMEKNSEDWIEFFSLEWFFQMMLLL